MLRRSLHDRDENSEHIEKTQNYMITCPGPKKLVSRQITNKSLLENEAATLQSLPDCMKKKVACLSAFNWFKTISLLFLAAAVGLIAAESLPAVAFTTILGSAVGGTGAVGGTLFGGLRVGNLVRLFFPISEYKIRCWRRKLRGNWNSTNVAKI